MLISDLEDLDIKPIEAFKQIWTEPRYSFVGRPRKNYGMLYVVDGEVTYKTQNGKIALKSGDIIFLCAGDCYKVEFSNKKSKVETFLLNFDISDTEEKDKLSTSKLNLNDEHKNLLCCFKELSNAYANKESVFLIKSLFYKCIYNIKLLQHTQTATKETLTLEYAKNLLTDFEELSVEEIALRLSMSHSTFQRRFKAAYGLTPVEFRCGVKIDKAKLMLSTTDIPIKEIALTLKYYDEAYFNKQFKRNCGITPKQYRERYLNGL